MNLLIYSWNGQGNIGDDWISKLSRDFLENQNVDVNCIMEPHPLSSNIQFGDLIWTRFFLNFREVFVLRRNFAKFDALLFAGGGWFAGDQNMRNTLMWCFRIFLCPIPIYTFGIGIGPFVNRRQKFLFRLISKRISNFDLRHVSDAENLMTLGVAEFTISGDLSFLDAVERDCSHGDIRDLCLVVLPGIGNRRSREDIAKLGSQIWNWIDDRGISEDLVQFVSFQNEPHDDYLSWKEIFPNRQFAKDIYEAKSIFKKAKYVFAGRLHAGLAAARFEVPEIAVIPYHHKFQLLRELGLHIPIKTYNEFEFRRPDIEATQNYNFAVKESFHLLLSKISQDLTRG